MTGRARREPLAKGDRVEWTDPTPEGDARRVGTVVGVSGVTALVQCEWSGFARMLKTKRLRKASP